MGLDMMLYKNTYIGNHYKEPEKQVKVVAEGIKQERVSDIVERVGYWRKANQIHNWFVKNVQDGEDNCNDYDVSTEQLQELIDTCKQVLASTKLINAKIKNGSHNVNGKMEDNMIDGKKLEDSSVAEKLLPTAGGFFFGGTDYDEYYWQDLEETIKMLEPLIVEGGDFSYRSSW